MVPTETRMMRFLRDKLGLLDPSKYAYVIDYCEKRPILEADLDWDPATTPTQVEMRLVTQANQNWGISGASATSSAVALAISGGFSVATGVGVTAVVGPATLAAGAQPVSAVSAMSYLSDKEPFFAARVSFSSSLTKTYAHGLKLTNATGKSVDADQAIFHFDTADGVDATRFRILSSATNVDTEKVARYINGQISDPVAMSTLYDLIVRVDSQRIPQFYLNGRHVGAGAQLTTAINLRPFFGQTRLAGTPLYQVHGPIVVGRLIV